MGNTSAFVFFFQWYDIQDQLARDLGGGRPSAGWATITTITGYLTVWMIQDSEIVQNQMDIEWCLTGCPPNVKGEGDLGMMFELISPAIPATGFQAKNL